MQVALSLGNKGRVSGRFMLRLILATIIVVTHFSVSVILTTEKTKLLLLDGCGMPVNTTAKVNKDGHDNDEKKEPKFCTDEHQRAIELCVHNDKNVVLSRTDLPYAFEESERLRSWGQLRPYSILSISKHTPLPHCQNLDDYLSAIKLGTRKWQNYVTDDAEPSIFAPHMCYVPSIPPPPTKTCDLLGQYNHVMFHGDSLTRHLRQAFYMSMRGDFVKGATKQDLEQCVCDGQFSEVRVCWQFESYFDKNVRPRDIPGANICSGALPFTMARQAKAIFHGTSLDWGPVDCTDPNYRGILLVLQGGLHYKMNAKETFQKVVHPVVTHPKFRECACVGKIRLIWLSAGAQSTLADKKYPHQSRTNATLFNEEIRNFFIFAGFLPGRDIVIFDWWNLTADAQSSDGVHSLSDVNLAKAAQILYLAEHWPFSEPYRTTQANRKALQIPKQFTILKGQNISVPFECDI